MSMTSYARTSIPNALALFATSYPILPKPTIPIVFCQSSVPLSFFFSHRSFFIELSARAIFLARANMSEKTISATETEGASGVFWTETPFASAAFLSTLSRPTPALTTSLSLSDASITSLVIFVALLTTTPSKPLICFSMGPSFSTSLNTISSPAAFNFATADSSIGSAINTRFIAIPHKV